MIGTPEMIRTSDPQIRSLILYPAELRAHSDASVTVTRNKNRFSEVSLLRRIVKNKNRFSEVFYFAHIARNLSASRDSLLEHTARKQKPTFSDTSICCVTLRERVINQLSRNLYYHNTYFQLCQYLFYKNV